MSYQALYRVWRPTRLEDVVGQEHITTTLKNALVQEKLSHAYLFTGPRGTGKTSAAKIISKAINCERAPIEEPCNECASCKGVQDGTIVDVMEIDAASNNGVDEIRDIRDKVKFAPSAVKYKVYIIDEVHMLSTGAFNALLKTLEEPPAHVIFILATTEPHKIPLTIISRCQRFDFKRVNSEAMISRMKEIIEAIDARVHEDALTMIARVSEGGMRDALSLLDQAISFADEEVSLSDILSITGAVSKDLLFDVAEALQAGDVAKGLTVIDAVVKEGKDPSRFLEDLMYFYRDILMVKAAPELDESKVKIETDDRFREMVESTDEVWIYAMMEKLNHFQQEMKWTNHSRVFLEMFIVQASQLNRINGSNMTQQKESNEDIAALVNRVAELEAVVRHLKNGIGQGQAAAGAVDTKRERQPQPQRVMQSSGRSRAQIGQVKAMLNDATKPALQAIQSQWPYVLEKAKQENVAASAWLYDCQPVASSPTEVVLAFKNEMHCDMIDGKFRALVESVLSSVIGRSTTFFALLHSHWEETRKAFFKEQQLMQGDSSKQEEKEQDDPLIAEAVKLVGEELVEIKE